MNKLSIISKKVGEKLVFEEIDSSLETLQAKVGGYIESVLLPLDIIMWLNDSGMIDGLPLNLITIADGREVHRIYGDIFFTSFDAEGETISLSEKQKKWIENRTKIIGTVEDKHYVYGIFVR